MQRGSAPGSRIPDPSTPAPCDDGGTGDATSADKPPAFCGSKASACRLAGAEIRRILEGIAIPDDLAAAITHQLARLGEQGAYAVRSSATARDQAAIAALKRDIRTKSGAALLDFILADPEERTARTLGSERVRPARRRRSP